MTALRKTLLLFLSLLTSTHFIKGEEVTPPEPKHSPVQSIGAGVSFLLKTQNKDGSWGNHTKTKGLNIYAPIPGAHLSMRAASTALCLLSLLHAEDYLEESKERQKAVDASLNFLLDFLPKVKRDSPTVLYNLWSSAYSLRAFSNYIKRFPNTQKLEEITAVSALLVKQIEQHEVLGGGWGYYNFARGNGPVTKRPSYQSFSFMNATLLHALNDANVYLNLEIDPKLIQRALKSTIRQRLPDGSFVYAQNLRKAPRHQINRPAGSLSRTPACYSALLINDYFPPTVEELTASVGRFIHRNDWLAHAMKRPIPHNTHFAISGYFYYYGVFYTTECFPFIEKAKQGEFATDLANIIMSKQEPSGKWWDYPLYNYHDFYGTGYAMTALCRLIPYLETQ